MLGRPRLPASLSGARLERGRAGDELDDNPLRRAARMCPARPVVLRTRRPTRKEREGIDESVCVLVRCVAWVAAEHADQRPGYVVRRGQGVLASELDQVVAELYSAYQGKPRAARRRLLGQHCCTASSTTQRHQAGVVTGTSAIRTVRQVLP